MNGSRLLIRGCIMEAGFAVFFLGFGVVIVASIGAVAYTIYKVLMVP